VKVHLATVIAAVLLALCTTAFADPAPPPAKEYQLDIRKQPLGPALEEFARQTGLQIAALSEVVSGNSDVGPLKGTYSLQRAMDSLLRSQHLTFSLVDARTIVVRREGTEGSAGAATPANSGAGGGRARAQHQNDVAGNTRAPTGKSGVGLAHEEATAGQATQIGDDETEDKKPTAEVIVTGTHIQQDGMNTPTPVTVLTAAQMDLESPGNIIDAFMQLPQFLGSSDPTQNNGIGTEAGQSILNMRDLGENRTLVLLDGRRIVPATYNGTIDINVLPQSLLKRVEVVTGGASAAYGTDAVAGVTNFILDTEYTGLKARVQGGLTTYGDGANKEGELTFGTTIGQQAHLVASVDYYENNPIEAVRPWMQSWGVVNNSAYTPGGTQPQQLVEPNVGSSIYTPGGLIIAPGTALNNLMFLPNGSAVPFQFTSLSSQTGLQSQSGGGAYDFRTDGSLNGGLESGVSRYNGFAHLSADVTDDVEVYGEVLQGHNDVKSRGFPSVMFGAYQATIYADNAYLPASISQIMQQDHIASFGFSRISTPADLTVDTLDQSNSTTQFTAGLKAVLPGDWHINSYLQHGHNENDLADENYPRTDRLFLALDAVVDPATGAITCKIDLVQPGYGCIPLDLLGAGRATPQAIAYVTAGTKTAYLTNNLDTFEATADGQVFKDRAPGPISLAFGVDYRHSTLTQNVADPTNPTNNPDYVAVPLNNPALGIEGIPDPFAGANSGVQFSIQANFRGVINVEEGFGEVLVPLLKDEPFVKQLNLSLAGRWADYTASGGIWSYKYGLDWQTLDWLRFRGTYSRDVRAADMSERFNAAGGGTTVNDPFMGGQSEVFTEIIGGNPNVRPEKANTYSTGIVLQPTFAPGLSFSVDWYSINIKDAIALLGAQQIVNDCYEGAKQLCALIRRDPVTNLIIGLNDIYLNINSEKVVGTDVEGDYRIPFSGSRSLTLRLLGGYLEEFALANLGAPVAQEAGTTGNLPLPRVQLNLGANYQQGPYSVFLSERFISDGRREWNDDEPALGGVTINDDHIASALYTDLNLAYTLNMKGVDWQVFLNIQNLLDRAPPRVPIYSGFIGTTDTNRALFDVLGRRFVLGVKMNLK
jgi:iron complex outermembrane recepter protein